MKTINLRVDLTNMSAAKEALGERVLCMRTDSEVLCCFIKAAVLPFSKLNKLFFGCFDPKNIFLDNENN